MTAIAPNAATHTDLLDEVEWAAREAARSLEATGKLLAGYVAFSHPQTASEEREGRRLYAALMLADSAETFVALVKREAVPTHRLNQTYLKVLQRWPQPNEEENF